MTKLLAMVMAGGKGTRLFNPDVLVALLDEASRNGGTDFGRHVMDCRWIVTRLLVVQSGPCLTYLNTRQAHSAKLRTWFLLFTGGIPCAIPRLTRAARPKQQAGR